MNPHKEYLLQFSGLKDGLHAYSYQVNNEFFESFEQTLVAGGDVHVKLDMDKHSDHLNLHFTYKGNLLVDCDRCAVSAAYPIVGESNLIVQFEQGESDDDDIIFLSPEAYEFNIAQYLYETLALSLPLKIVPCEQTGDNSICDQEVIKKLEALSVTESFDKEEDSSQIDPRWEALKKLSDK